MDFYEAQEEARKKTRKLGFLFTLSVLFVMIAVGILFVIIFYQGNAYLSDHPVKQPIRHSDHFEF